MFFGLQPWHLAVIIIVGLLIFGPDKLPTMAKDAGRVLRQLRRMANDVKDDLQEELGPELGGLDLSSMHPKALIHKHLLDPALDDEPPVAPQDAVPAAPAPVAAAAPAPVPVAAVAGPPATPYDLDAT